MAGTASLDDKTRSWLMDPENPEVRFLAMRDLEDRPPDDPELISAKQVAHEHGPIRLILDQMHPEGYWVKPGAGYSPKYTSTVWSLILLAQLGASAREDEKIAKAYAYLLEHALTPGGQFSHNGAPSGTIDCLQGNMLWSLLELGCTDPRLGCAFEWMARSITGEGVAPSSDKSAEIRYFAYKCGPIFACGANNNQPCAWGASKVMLAFSRLPESWRSPLIDRAIQQGVDFLFSIDPATATWPSGWADKPSGNWWKFGFPVFYVTDLLQVAESLVKLGYANDPRLKSTLEVIRGKQDEKGRWILEYDYNGKTWVDFGKKKQPNKWVTLRALRVLKGVG